MEERLIDMVGKDASHFHSQDSAAEVVLLEDDDDMAASHLIKDEDEMREEDVMTPLTT